MSFSIDRNSMMREIMMDHYQNPRNKEEVNDPRYVEVHMDSASCTDDIYISLLEEDGIIKDCKWHGHGCAVSTASTSIMTELVIGKTKEEALKIMDEFNKMLNSEDYDEDVLGEAFCFSTVNRQPSRITCANISWRGLKKALEVKDCEGHKH